MALVALDNLSAHKAASIREALAACGCDLLFQPPDAPDFTPIEQAFSQLKAILRGLGARTQETLQEAVLLAVEAITHPPMLPRGMPMRDTPYPLNPSESCSK